MAFVKLPSQQTKSNIRILELVFVFLYQFFTDFVHLLFTVQQVYVSYISENSCLLELDDLHRGSKAVTKTKTIS